MKSKTYSFGIIRIRQRGKKYYVYIIEKDKDGQRRDHYVDPLDKIVKTYLALGVLEDPVCPYTFISIILCLFMIECRDLALNHLLGGSWDSFEPNGTGLTSP